MASAFIVDANGTPGVGFRVRYYDDMGDITLRVARGLCQTPSLEPGTSHEMWAFVQLQPNVVPGMIIRRLVTVTSASYPTAEDVIKFTVTALAM